MTAGALLGALLGVVLTRGRYVKLPGTFGAGLGAGISYERVADAYSITDFAPRGAKGFAARGPRPVA